MIRPMNVRTCHKQKAFVKNRRNSHGNIVHCPVAGVVSEKNHFTD